MVLTRVGVLSCGKVMGVMYTVMGLIIGFFVAVSSLLGAAIGSAASDQGAAWLGALLGVGAIVVFPAFYGAMGFVGGLLSALFYNWIAGLIGGIEVEFEQRATPGATQGLPSAGSFSLHRIGSGSLPQTMGPGARVVHPASSHGRVPRNAHQERLWRLLFV